MVYYPIGATKAGAKKQREEKIDGVARRFGKINEVFIDNIKIIKLKP
jgi:hypothetical protein